MIEHDVRQMLARRAEDAAPAPDAWERIVARIGDDAPDAQVIELAPQRRRFNGKTMLTAVAAAVLIVFTSLVVIQNRGGDQDLETADEGTSPAPSNPEPGPIAAGAFSDRPVWPATTDEGLARLQAEADAGRRPDLLDPRAVAGGYLSERLLDPSTRRSVQPFKVNEFLEGDPSSGEVPYESPTGSDAGWVLVRRSGGDGSIWYVVGSNSRSIAVKVAAYDGSELAGEVVSSHSGSLDIRVSSTDGNDPANSDTRPVAAGNPVDLRLPFAGKPGVVVQLRLTQEPSGTISFAEIRLDRFPTAEPPPPPSFVVKAESAARQWTRALLTRDADLAWSLLAEPSRKVAGGRGGFDARFTELAEGWGAWGAAEDISYRVIDLLDVGSAQKLPAPLPQLAVVVLSGQLSQEGVTTFSTVSLPVRGTTDKAELDPFSDFEIELDKPDGARTGPGNVLGAYAPSGARVWFVIDDRHPVGPDKSDGADGDQQHATLAPAPPLSPGRHSITVVALRVDGAVASRSATYTVGP